MPPAVPSARRRAARGVLERIGSATANDVVLVLDQETHASWEGIIREELARSCEAPPDVRRADAEAWIDGSSIERTQAWLGGLLELPPEEMELLVGAALQALGSRDAPVKERFRSDVSRAAARFHVPQLLRLEETFRRLAAELGEPWS